MPSEVDYWFAAKPYGWGWGLPITWQRWLVFAAFIALIVIGTVLFPPRKMLGAYVVYVAVLCALLIGICWLKGEPPRRASSND